MRATPQGGPFVAALGVDDLFLVEQLGLAPVGGVLGYTVHAADRADPALLPPSLADAADQVGGTPPGEDTLRSAALAAAWTLCLTRLLVQAQDLDADGVVGVDLRVDVPGGDLLTVTAHGTAVRSAGGDVPWRTDSSGPFTTTLSGRDLWLLVRTGYRPLGIALGASFGPAPRSGAGVRDGEHAAATQAVYDARERALARMRAEADLLGADGVVAARVEGLPPPPGAETLRMVATGTAVRRLADRPPAGAPDVVLPLAGGRS